MASAKRHLTRSLRLAFSYLNMGDPHFTFDTATTIIIFIKVKIASLKSKAGHL